MMVIYKKRKGYSMNFLSIIPGFRSSTLWKSVVAVLYYLISIYYFIHSWGMLLFLMSTPFALFSFMDIAGWYQVGYSYSISKNTLIISTILVIISAIAVFHSFFNIRTLKMKANSKTHSIKPKRFKDLRVHFLSIGQADSILVQQGNTNILIDGGYWMSGKPILRYLRGIGIDKLDYLIVTHPHNDHIGGLPRIINNMPIDNIIINNKNPYETKRHHKKHVQLLELIKKKDINLINPVAGKSLKVGDLNLKILAPNGEGYERINDYSIVTRLVYKDTSFLFAADAEQHSEKEMLNHNRSVRSDVLKVGHHGSCTSSSEEFLKAVSPKYAVISVGYNSFYGQPDKCVLDRLNSIGATLYRTDKRGTIIATSDGYNIKFNRKSCSYPKIKIPYTSVRLKYRALHSSKGSD